MCVCVVCVYVCMYIILYNICLYLYMICNVWIKGMEQRYGADPSNRYGTGVWNGCGPGPCWTL